MKPQNQKVEFLRGLVRLAERALPEGTGRSQFIEEMEEWIAEESESDTKETGK